MDDVARARRAVVVIDYQNVHLTGHGQFASTRLLPKHEALVDPLLFVSALIRTRNAAQRPGMAQAVLRKVRVYGGLPAPEHDPDAYRRNLAQQAQWERDRRVQVTLRSRLPVRLRCGRPEHDECGRSHPRLASR